MKASNLKVGHDYQLGTTIVRYLAFEKKKHAGSMTTVHCFTDIATMDKHFEFSANEVAVYISEIPTLKELVEKEMAGEIGYKLAVAPKRTSTRNIQIGGDHYKRLAIQPWEIIRANELDFFQGNVVKYVMRYKKKNGLEDLEKCLHYVQEIIEDYKKVNRK